MPRLGAFVLSNYFAVIYVPVYSLVPKNLVVALAKLQTGDSRPGAILFRRRKRAPLCAVA